jgi:hypothetical protein
MSREVEIIITYDKNKYDNRTELFLEWIKGWAWSEYKATVSRYGPGMDALSIAGVDMFKLFVHLYRKLEIMRRRLGADVAVAICEGDECIDMSEMSWPKIMVRDDDLERLARVVGIVKGLIVGERLDDVDVGDHGDFIRLSTKKNCIVDLQVDEAVMLARWLIGELYSLTRFEAFLRAGDEISKVFDPLEMVYMPDVSLRHVKEGVYILSVEWCSNIYLTADELLRLIYKTMDTAVLRLKIWKEYGT